MKILKEFADLAALAIGNAKKIEQVKNENVDLKEELGFKFQLVGKSSAFRNVISDAFKVANSKSSALILGESGTGKELLARLIHGAGPRKDKPLIIINCAALPETLLEDELFGHEKGAFTGATSRKIGKFELADKGTIFLDEIAEMSPGMQAKLLRVLQEGRFYRVGGNTPIAVDVRVISATISCCCRASHRRCCCYSTTIARRKLSVLYLLDRFDLLISTSRASCGRFVCSLWLRVPSDLLHFFCFLLVGPSDSIDLHLLERRLSDDSRRLSNSSRTVLRLHLLLPTPTGTLMAPNKHHSYSLWSPSQSTILLPTIRR